MDDILAKKNRHLFLEEKDNVGNSFIANVNNIVDDLDNIDVVANDLGRIDTVADNIDNVNTVAENIDDINTTVENLDKIDQFNDNLVGLLESLLEQLGEDGNAWLVRLTELGESILATTSAFNYAVTTTLVQNITSGATLTLPDAMKYRVGTHMLMVSWNGTVCYIDDQYSEIGEFGEWSTSITMNVPLKTGDKIQFRVVALADIAAFAGQVDSVIGNTSVVATGSTENRTLANRFADIVNVKDFGAVGNGVVDDTTAFQNALATNKAIFVPEGTYKLTTDLTGNFCSTGNSTFTGGTINGSTILRGTAQKNNDIINVKDFGAVGDGVTDDTSAIEAAIAAANDNQIVFFPGDYEFLVSTINITKEVTLVGGRIKSHGTAIDINTSETSAPKGSLISGMEITADEIGIKVTYAGGVRITDCEIFEAQNYGIHIVSYNEIYVNNTRITCSTGADSGTGIRIDCSDCIFTNILIMGYQTGIEETGGGNRYTNVHAWGPASMLSAEAKAKSTFIKTRGKPRLVQCVADGFARTVWIKNQYACPILIGMHILHGDSGWEDIHPEIIHLQDSDDYAVDGHEVVTYADKLFLIIGCYSQGSNSVKKFINYTGSIVIPYFYTYNAIYDQMENAPIRGNYITGSIWPNSYTSLNFLDGQTFNIAAMIKVGEDANGKPYLTIGSEPLNGAYRGSMTFESNKIVLNNTAYPSSAGTRDLGSAGVPFGKGHFYSVHPATVTANDGVIDLSLGTAFYVSPSEDITITLSNPVVDCTTHFYVVLANSGHTVTWPDTIRWENKTLPNFTSNGVDVISIFSGSGRTWYGKLEIKNAGVVTS